MSNVEALPVKREMMAGGSVKPIIPQSMEDAYRLATAVVKAKMAPRGMDTPESCMIAIMHGLEIGLTPLAALQRIAVVNGRPVIWGDGAMGLVRGSGLCEFVNERIDGDGDQMIAVCEAKRKGEKQPIVRSFSVEEAKKAGLWGKQGPWTQFPRRMLQMRARAFALRDGFADVLGGLYLKEEIEGERELRDVTPQPPSPPPAPPAPPAAEQEIMPPKKAPKRQPGEPRTDRTPYADKAKQEATDHDPETGEVVDDGDPFDPDNWLDGLESMLAGCADQDTLDEVWNAYAQPLIEKGAVMKPDREKAEEMWERHVSRVEGDDSPA